MPEGPSLIILKEKIKPFEGKKVIAASGYADVNYALIKGKVIRSVETWGKHLLIVFNKFTVKIHLMMFGSYTINEEKKYNPKLSLQFGKDIVNFYLCQVTILEQPLDEIYDWTADIMSKKWSSKNAKDKLAKKPAAYICDVILDQAIFSGAGNIIKNEVLYRIKMHPLSIAGNVPPVKITALIDELKKYSFEFLRWRKEGTLSAHWEAYEQEICLRCGIPLHKKITGKGKRLSYFCTNCQEKY